MPEESQTPRKAAARIVRLGQLDPTAAAAVHRVADAVEQVLYAPRPRLTAGLTEDVHLASAGLRATVGRGTLAARAARPAFDRTGGLDAVRPGGLP